MGVCGPSVAAPMTTNSDLALPPILLCQEVWFQTGCSGSDPLSEVFRDVRRSPRLNSMEGSSPVGRARRGCTKMYYYFKRSSVRAAESAQRLGALAALAGR